MPSKISRRDFLKLAGVALGGLAFSPYAPALSQFDDSQLIRVATTQLSVYSQPNDKSRIVRPVYRDDILHVYEEVNSGTPGYNPVWYRVWGGYVHRAHTQKVQYIYNNPATSIRETKQIAEITVPYTRALRLVGKEWQLEPMLYFGTVQWVVGIDEGPDGEPWYRVQDEANDIDYNVAATHLRLIPDEEIAPISPDVPFTQKRIEVSLNMQTVTCYEYDKPVFHTTISSGLPNVTGEKSSTTTRTPQGDFYIEVKMPSKHMGNGSLAADVEAYELLGVPWVSFFTAQGHAFHGTYWHDNFGVPMSHGCVNMRTDEAKWFFRWCLSAAPADQISPQTLDKKCGYDRTPVKIRA
ncbi:MAG: L,D-transpeptidase family protein [Anaerolineales bacterium]